MTVRASLRAQHSVSAKTTGARQLQALVRRLLRSAMNATQIGLGRSRQRKLNRAGPNAEQAGAGSDGNVDTVQTRSIGSEGVRT